MIVSRQNQKLKDIRRLQRCKGERAILEGPHLVREALRAGLDLEFAIATPEFTEQEVGRDLLSDSGLSVSLIEDRLLQEICDSDSPRGILAVASLPPTPLASVPLVDRGVYVYVDGMQDPGNLGALARIVEAFGAIALILGPATVHPNHPRALRASAGSLLRVSVASDVSATDLTAHLGPISPSWAVMTPRNGVSLDELSSLGTLIMTIGAEGPGVSSRVLEQADILVSIPLAGDVESLNSTVAASIALYQLSRSRSLS